MTRPLGPLFLVCAICAAAVLTFAPAPAAAYTSAGVPTLTSAPGSPYATDPDTATGSSETELDVSYAPDGKTVVVANRAVNGTAGGSLTLMNVSAEGALTPAGPSVRLPNYVDGVAYDPEGGYVVVLNGEDDPSDGSFCDESCLTLFSVGANGTFTRVGSTLDTDEIYSFAFTPSGDGIVATTPVTGITGYSVGSGGISKVDVAALPSGSTPGGTVSFNPSGSLAAVADAGSNDVDLLSVGNNGGVSLIGTIPTGGQVPTDTAFSPDGSLLAVVNQNSYNLSMFHVDGDSLTPVSGSPYSDPEGVYPDAVAFSPHGWLAVVSSGSLYGYNLAGDGTLEEPGIYEGPVGAYGGHPAFSPTGQFVDIGDAGSGTVYVYADHAAPAAQINSPAGGGVYTVGQQVPTSFACSDSAGAPGIASCSDSNNATNGVGALNTSAVGTFTYSVTAASLDGLTGTTQITYTVTSASQAPQPNPTPAPGGPAAVGSGSGGSGSGGSGSGGPNRKTPATGAFSLLGTLSAGGSQSVTVTNPNDFSATYRLSVTTSTESLSAHALSSASPRPDATKTKVVSIASVKKVLRAHTKATLTLRLSETALKTLRRTHHLKVTLRLNVSATGHGTGSLSRTVTLKLASHQPK